MTDAIPKRRRSYFAIVVGCGAVVLVGAGTLLFRMGQQALETDICTRCGLMRNTRYVESGGLRLPGTERQTCFDSAVSRSLRACGAACAGPHAWVYVHGRGGTWSASGPGSEPRVNARSDLVAAFLVHLNRVAKQDFEIWRSAALSAGNECCCPLDFVLQASGFDDVQQSGDAEFREWWYAKRGDVAASAISIQPRCVSLFAGTAQVQPGQAQNVDGPGDR